MADRHAEAGEPINAPAHVRPPASAQRACRTRASLPVTSRLRQDGVSSMARRRTVNRMSYQATGQKSAKVHMRARRTPPRYRAITIRNGAYQAHMYASAPLSTRIRSTNGLNHTRVIQQHAQRRLNALRCRYDREKAGAPAIGTYVKRYTFFALPPALNE